MSDIWSEAPNVFHNISDVARWVSARFKTREGKPVSERTVRGHLQGRGKKGKLLYPRPEGGYALEDVQDYTGRQGYVPVGQDPLMEEKEKTRDQVALEIQKAQRELEKIILQNQKLEHELQEKRKEFCRIEDLDAELAARGLALRHFLEQHFTERSADIAGSEPDKVVGVAMEGVDKALNDYVSLQSFYVLQVDE